MAKNKKNFCTVSRPKSSLMRYSVRCAADMTDPNLFITSSSTKKTKQHRQRSSSRQQAQVVLKKSKKITNNLSIKQILRQSKPQLKESVFHEKQSMGSSRLNDHDLRQFKLYKPKQQAQTKKYKQSPENLFKLGCYHFYKGQYQLALFIFKDVKKRSNFHSNPQLLFYLAILSKKLEQNQDALQYIQQYLNAHPKDIDARAFRAKLQFKLNQPLNALKEFKRLYKTNKHNISILLGLADCLRGIKEYKQANQIYDKAFFQSPLPHIMIKKGINLMQINQYQQALQLFNLAISKDPYNDQIFLLKGLALSKSNRISQAQLVFQNIIQQWPQSKSAKKAIQYIIKALIQDRDYYGALYKIEQYIYINDQKLNRLKKFVQGSTNCMKGYYIEGIKELTNMINQGNYSRYLQPLLLANRSYGYFCIGRHTQAQLDLKTLKKIVPLSDSSKYNRLLLKGLRFCMQKQQDKIRKAINYFKKAEQLRPKLAQPLFYQVIC